MGKKFILIVFLLFLSFQGSSLAEALNTSNDFTIKVASTEWPPYVYLENGKIQGSAYKISTDILKRVGISFKFQLQPWKRVYHRGLNEDNFLICGLGRTTNREKLFQWIGPLTNGLDIYFYKRKSTHLQIKNVDNAKNFKIGVVRGGYAQDYLFHNGFKPKRILDVTNPGQLWEILEKNRLPFILLPTNMEPLDLENSHFERAMFAFRVTDYLAASKQTPRDLIEKLKSAYNDLKKEGKIVLE